MEYIKELIDNSLFTLTDEYSQNNDYCHVASKSRIEDFQAATKQHLRNFTSWIFAKQWSFHFEIKK